LLLFTDM